MRRANPASSSCTRTGKTEGRGKLDRSNSHALPVKDVYFSVAPRLSAHSRLTSVGSERHWTTPGQHRAHVIARGTSQCQDGAVDTDTVTIDQVLDAFLEDQRRRLSARTMRNYEDVVGLLCHSLNGYAYESLDKADAKRFDKAYQAGDEEAFCHLFGPEHILDHLGEFLGYFMVRKVMGSQELLRSAGTVTKKLATWLYEQGYVSDDEREIAVDRGTEAARDLPRAEHLASLLYDQSRAAPDFDPGALGNGDLVEDYLMIDRIEPGALYFAGGIGPLGVSEQASALAEVGWGVNITLARISGAWFVVEVGNVYSM